MHPTRFFRHNRTILLLALLTLPGCHDALADSKKPGYHNPDLQQIHDTRLQEQTVQQSRSDSKSGSPQKD